LLRNLVKHQTLSILEHFLSNEIENWLSDFHNLNTDTEIVEEEDDKKKFKLDLFKTVLPAIERGDKFFYRNLRPEEQNDVEPWILMRWLTSADSDRDQVHYLLSVNDLVNNNFSRFSPKKTLGIEGHKELQWMLLTLCGTGRFVKRKFIKPPRGMIKDKLETALLQFFPSLRSDELELIIKLNSTDELKQFFIDNGFDDKTVNDIFKGNNKES